MGGRYLGGRTEKKAHNKRREERIWKRERTSLLPSRKRGEENGGRIAFEEHCVRGLGTR